MIEKGIFGSKKKSLIHKKPKIIQKPPQFIHKKPKEKQVLPQKVIKINELERKLSSRSSRRLSNTQELHYENSIRKKSHDQKENSQTGFKSFYMGDQASMFNSNNRKSPSFAPDLDVQGAYQATPQVKLDHSSTSLGQMTNK